MLRKLVIAAALLLGGIPGASVVQARAPLAAECDRACLIGIADTYLAALATRDPSDAPISPGAKFVENGAEIRVGEGLWYGAGPNRWDLRIMAADPVNGQVGFLGSLAENDEPIILILRLKVEDFKITEIEHRVERKLPPRVVSALTTAEIFKKPVPASERVSRTQMIGLAHAYFDAIEQGDASAVPFARNCERYESAERTSNAPLPPERLAQMSAHDRKFWTAYREMGCAAQIDTNALRHINMLFPRRILVVDEEASMVFTFPTFVHKGDIQTVAIKNVPGITELTLPTAPSDTLAGEVFLIRRGEIEGVQVSGARVPYGTKTGWE